MAHRKVPVMLDWIDPESWAAFVAMRKQIKAPLTPYAEKLILRELVKLKSAGQDPQACLDQSIMLGWRDVFPVRDKGVSLPQAQQFQAEAPLTQEQKEAADKARRMAMSAIKRVV